MDTDLVGTVCLLHMDTILFDHEGVLSSRIFIADGIGSIFLYRDLIQDTAVLDHFHIIPAVSRRVLCVTDVQTEMVHYEPCSHSQDQQDPDDRNINSTVILKCFRIDVLLSSGSLQSPEHQFRHQSGERTHDEA